MSEVIIIGGGLAGAGAAIHLAHAGRQVTLIEKETGPHDKVCGEFLSGEAVGYLAALGIDLPVLGAVTIDHVSFAGHTKTLPFPALSLSRRVLDEAMLLQAQKTGVTVLRGRKAQAVEQQDNIWTVKLDDAEVIKSQSVFLASGKHDVRGHKRAPGKQNDLVAFKMHYRLQPAQQRQLAGMVDLFLFPGGYGGLEPVEAGRANLCFLICRAAFEKLGGWEQALDHICASSILIADRLANAQPLWEKPLAISAIPYGYVRRDSHDGLWRLGDQSAVIPSFSGDGMSIALHSANLAAATYLAGGSAVQYQARMAHDVGKQVALATMVSRALVNPVGQKFCKLAAGLVPRLIGTTARATRIPQKLLLQS